MSIIEFESILYLGCSLCLRVVQVSQKITLERGLTLILLVWLITVLQFRRRYVCSIWQCYLVTIWRCAERSYISQEVLVASYVGYYQRVSISFQCHTKFLFLLRQFSTILLFISNWSLLLAPFWESGKLDFCTRKAYILSVLWMWRSSRWFFGLFVFSIWLKVCWFLFQSTRQIFLFLRLHLNNTSISIVTHFCFSTSSSLIFSHYLQSASALFSLFFPALYPLPKLFPFLSLRWLIYFYLAVANFTIKIICTNLEYFVFVEKILFFCHTT